ARPATARARAGGRPPPLWAGRHPSVRRPGPAGTPARTDPDRWRGRATARARRANGLVEPVGRAPPPTATAAPDRPWPRAPPPPGGLRSPRSPAAPVPGPSGRAAAPAHRLRRDPAAPYPAARVAARPAPARGAARPDRGCAD